MKIEGTITPSKIFAVLVLAAGIYLSVQLNSVTVAVIYGSGALALYGVRKLLVKEMMKFKNGNK